MRPLFVVSVFVLAMSESACPDDAGVAERDASDEVDTVAPDTVAPDTDGSDSGDSAANDVDVVGDTGSDTLVSVAFRAADADLPNPDRGFYAFVDDLTGVATEDLAAEFERGVRLVYSPIRLDAYRSDDIAETELALLSRGMDRVREAGLGLILRFTYNYPETEADYLDAQDAPLERVRGHLSQLAPIIAAHADVITFWQAGFIGAWGEWHTSSNGLTTDASKAAVRDALLEVLPRDTFLQLRYPPDIVAAVGSEAAPEVDFATTPRSRLGFHNDCFLSSDTDVGTFEGGLGDPLRDVMAALGAVAPFGGETCDAEEPTPQRRSCAAILAEGARYHLTYLNRDYHTAFHEAWKREGCFDEVTRSMGYRIALHEVTHPRTAEVGHAMRFAVRLANTGWARPFARRELSVDFIGEAGVFRARTGIDARRLTPGEHGLEVNVLVPALPPGDYAIALAFPAPGDAPDARRALRFAVAPDPASGQGPREDGSFTTGTSVRVLPPNGTSPWHPRDLPDARVYDASLAVTLDEPPASRRMAVMQASSSPWHPRDGAGLVWFRERLWLLGGWYGTGVAIWGGDQTTNEVWVSDDVGKTWEVVLEHQTNPPESGPGARWAGRHTVGFLAYQYDNIDYLYVIGGDYRHPSGDVWRSRDGVAWEAVTLHAPWEGRILQMAAQYRGDLYVMGGQIALNDPTTALSDVWRSRDGGGTWTRLADAPWAPRGMVYDPVEHAGRLWVMGGGTYDDAPRTFFNDVWSFDGERWTEVLPNGRAPFMAREYHNTFAFDGELWVSSGYGPDEQNHGDFWHSADGSTWRQVVGLGIQPGHADGIAVTPFGVVHASGNAMNTEVHLMTSHEGAIMSGWGDLGGARSDLVAPAGGRPLWIARAFGDRPGVWLDGGDAYLQLARREAQPAGRSVFWIGRTSRTAAWPDFVNPAMTVVGDSTGGCRAQAGYSEDQVELVVTDAAGDWSDGHVRRGAGLTDDRPHLVGFTQAVDGAVEAWVDGARVGEPVSAAYDPVNMGWDRVGAGFADGHRAQVMLALVVVVPRVSSAEEIARLAAFARGWGVPVGDAPQTP